jgi:hypothetical protein
MPIESAPRDGSAFVTYTPGDEDASRFDIAYWSHEWEAFCKFGCGFDGVTHWMPLPPPAESPRYEITPEGRKALEGK